MRRCTRATTMAKVTCCYPGANMDFFNELAHEPTAACYRRLRMFKAGGVAQLVMCHPGTPWVSAGWKAQHTSRLKWWRYSQETQEQGQWRQIQGQQAQAWHLEQQAGGDGGDY